MVRMMVRFLSRAILCRIWVTLRALVESSPEVGSSRNLVKHGLKKGLSIWVTLRALVESNPEVGSSRNLVKQEG
jgi:hypothetical protein